jgi:hypothetical protein
MQRIAPHRIAKVQSSKSSHRIVQVQRMPCIICTLNSTDEMQRIASHRIAKVQSSHSHHTEQHRCRSSQASSAQGIAQIYEMQRIASHKRAQVQVMPCIICRRE